MKMVLFCDTKTTQYTFAKMAWEKYLSLIQFGGHFSLSHGYAELNYRTFSVAVLK